MRLAYFAAFAALPFSAFAEDFVLDAPITAVEVYPQGAKVTREVPYNVPAGAHRLILPDLPQGLEEVLLKAKLSDGAFSTEQIQRYELPLLRLPESDEIKSARAEQIAAEEALRAGEVKSDIAQGEVTAGHALAAFAAGLGQGKGEPLTPEALREIAALVAEKTTEASAQIVTAQAKVDGMARALKALRDNLTRATAKLASLTPEHESRSQFTGSLKANAATSGVLKVEYYVRDAFWDPVYNVYLTRGDEPSMKIERAIALTQGTGENWNGVDLTLSTRAINAAVAGAEPQAWLRRIMDTDGMRRFGSSAARPEKGMSAELDMVMEAPAPAIVSLATARGGGVSAGLDMIYHFPQKISAPSASAATLLELDTLEFDEPEIRAIAYAAGNDRAFAQATFKNTSGEAILAGDSRHFLDGVMVGWSSVQEIAAGAEADIGFGELRGIQLKRITKDREEGDSGVIRRSNDETDEVVITVENLTGEPWDLRLMDRVPYSEQEDLSIKWQASPTPSEQDIDGKRGVLQWDYDLKSGETFTVQLNTQIKWPDDYILQ